MSKHRVLIIGATGETGGDILEGLIEDGTFVGVSSFRFLTWSRCLTIDSALQILFHPTTNIAPLFNCGDIPY
jgi:hypothetical protein